MAGRILGMGDIVSLVEKTQEQFDTEQAEIIQKKIAKGKFTLSDFLGQMRQMQKLGPLRDIMKMIPGMGGQLGGMQLEGKEMNQMEAMILSMTPQERENPEVIEASRRRRIARGAGGQPQDVSGLVKSFGMAAGMMKQMAGMGMRDRMKFAQQMGQVGMAGGAMPNLKVKQRSKRLTAKQRTKRRKKGRKR
jgi:signal recognition particle subunit SRP54